MALRDRYDNDILKTFTRIANSLERIERTLSNNDPEIKEYLCRIANGGDTYSSDVKKMIIDDDGSELCPRCKCRLLNYVGMKECYCKFCGQGIVR